MPSPPQAAQKAQGSKRGGGGNAKFKTSKSEFGEWRPYLDKRKRGIFYYNRVSRVSQFEIPRYLGTIDTNTQRQKNGAGVIALW